MCQVHQTQHVDGCTQDVVTVWGIKYYEAPEAWMLGEVFEYATYDGASVKLTEETARANAERLNRLAGYYVEAVSQTRTVSFTAWKA